MTNNDRIPPFSEETEQSIIGCIIQNDTKVMPICVSRGITAEWFYTPAMRIVWEACLEMFAKQKYIDSLTITEQIKSDGDWERVGGFKTLEACIENAPTAARIDAYLDIAESKMLARRGITLCREKENEIYEAGDDELPQVIAGIQSEWCQIETRRQEEKTLPEIADGLIADWMAPPEEAEKRNRLRWPLDPIQESVGSLTDELVYIAARPSVGKTALIIQMLVQLGYAGVKSALASLESRKPKIVQRIISLVGQVNTRTLSRGYASATEKQRATETRDKIVQLSQVIRITDQGMTVDQLRAWGQMEKARGAEILAIDNMKHIRPAKSPRSTVEWFRELTANLKWLRDDLGLPLIVLHHLSREGQLSWSDDIERDADVVLHLDQDDDLSIPYTAQNGWMGRTIINFDFKKYRDGWRDLSIPVEFIPTVQTYRPWMDSNTTQDRTQADQD